MTAATWMLADVHGFAGPEPEARTRRFWTFCAAALKSCAMALEAACVVQPMIGYPQNTLQEYQSPPTARGNKPINTALVSQPLLQQI